jgi:hypothetical protein
MSGDGAGLGGVTRGGSACVAAELAVVDVDMVGVEGGAGLLAGIVGCLALGEVG